MGMENTITVKVENESYEKINYSAFSIAFCRTFTDIPYSQEIFDELNKIQKNNESKVSIPGRKIRMESSVVLRSEARYKLVNKLLVENGSKQVLEIASGLSPRGLTKDPDVNFVEIDLPKIISDKEKIVENISERSDLYVPDNLHFENGNALNLFELQNATKYFKKEPIVIINEGLLLYLDSEEKKKVAENVHALLSEFGGVWITPDIGIKKSEDNNKKNVDQNITEVSDIIGRDTRKNLFDNLDEAKIFYEDLGFSVEVHSFTEVEDQLVSPSRLKESKEYVKKTMESAVAFVMKIK